MKIFHIGMGVWPAVSRELSKLGEYRFMDWTQWVEAGAKEQMRKTMIEESEKFNPDVTFMQIQYDGVLDAETASKLKGYVINYTLDVIDPLPAWFKEVGREVDLTLFPDDEDVTEFWNDGIKADIMLPGYDETVFNPEGSRGQYGDVVFLGNSYPKDTHKYALTDFRWQVVREMKKEFSKEFKLYGFGWNDEEHKLGMGIADGVLMYRPAKEAECYRSCKIAVSMSHFERARYTSDRVFRAMGSGAFVLAKWYPEIEKDFEDGVHLRVWKDIDELKDLTRYYLSHDSERNAIAQEGQRMVSSSCTWGDRMKEIMGLWQR